MDDSLTSLPGLRTTCTKNTGAVLMLYNANNIICTLIKCDSLFCRTQFFLLFIIEISTVLMINNNSDVYHFSYK